MRGLSLVVAGGGHSSSRCAGLSLSRPLLLRSTGSRRARSVVVAHGPSCSAACGIFLDQGSNPCPLHRQADSQPLRHQGSPDSFIFKPIWPLVGVTYKKEPQNIVPEASVPWASYLSFLPQFPYWYNQAIGIYYFSGPNVP